MNKNEPKRVPLTDSTKRVEPKKIPLPPIDNNEMDILDAVAKNVIENFGQDNENNSESN